MTSSSFTETSLTAPVTLLEPWGKVPYEMALAKQEACSQAGQVGWILFAPPPTLTLGLRASASDILVPDAELKRRGLQVLRTNRGGQVTYHGPSQCVGFPIGNLKDFTGDPRGVRQFLQNVQKSLLEFLKLEMAANAIPPELHCRDDGAHAGIWMGRGAQEKKLVAFGMKFSRQGIGHGFALNLWPDENFSVINPCGQVGATPGALWQTPPGDVVVKAMIQRLSETLSKGFHF